jgi:hypothetical protein
MNQTTHHFVTVHGQKVFYREAGDASLPTIILLHGFPSSSFMFRNLIPLLADKFHVIAPDYIGFGQSDAPSAAAFDYPFDNLPRHITGLIDELGLKSYILYMHDYGGPIGFRIFTHRPQAPVGHRRSGRGHRHGYSPDHAARARPRLHDFTVQGQAHQRVIHCRSLLRGIVQWQPQRKPSAPSTSPSARGMRRRHSA